MSHSLRPLTLIERELCNKLLEREFPGVDRLREQLRKISTVIPVNEDGSIIEFCIPGHIRLKGGGQSVIPTEGQYLDTDGENVMAMIFIDSSGMLYQFERYKFEGEIQDWEPNADRLVLMGP